VNFWKRQVQRAFDTVVARGWAAYQDQDQPKTTHKEAGVSAPTGWRGMGLDTPYGLFQTKGYGLVEQMMRDEAFGTFLELKKSAALSVKITFEPYLTDDPKAVDIAESVEASYDTIKGSMVEALHDQLTAIEYGFSCANVVYQLIPSGDFAGKVGLKHLKVKDPSSIKFDVDEYMNIRPDGIIFTNADGYDERLRTDEFAVYTYRRRLGNPYGYPDTLRAYESWNSKRWMNKFWDIYCERFGTGTMMFKYKTDSETGDVLPTADEFAAVQSYMDNKQARSDLRVSQNWEIDMHEPTGRGADVFQQSIQARNIAIARALFFPDQIGFSDVSTGSFAKAQTHLSVFLWPLHRLHRDLEEVHREQVIKRMVDLNYGPQPGYPRMAFAPLTEEQKVQWLAAVTEAIKTGVITHDLEVENKVRSALELSEKEQEEDRRAGGSGTPPTTEPPEDGADVDDVVSDDGIGDIIPSRGKHQRHSFQLAKRSRALTVYERKMDIDGIIKFVNDTQSQFVDTWASHMAANLQSIKDYAKKTGLIANADSIAIEKLKMSRVADQRKSLQRAMLSQLYYGALQAQQEVERARAGNYEFSAGGAHQFAAIDVADMPITEIEKFFESKGMSISPAIRKAAATIKRKSVFVTGVENQSILAKAKLTLYRGLEKSDPVWTETQLAKIFNGYLKTGEITDKALGTAHRIELIARNNFSTAINDGRRVMFEDKDVAGFVEAYQWSAVLDDATTPTCEMLDGKVLRKEDVNSFGWPPIHHGCRSMIVPVTTGERYTIDKMPRAAERGDGFAHCGRSELLVAV